MKEKFITSTIILMVGGLLTKLLGMIIKIVMSRLIGTEGLGLYMMILPTFSLFIGLAQFGLPIAISKLVAEDSKNNSNLILSLLPISFIINVLLIVFIIIISPFLANNLLHEPRSFYPLLSIALVIPLTSLSSMVRSYFFGKQKMLPHVISNLVEDMVRLLSIVIGVPFFIKMGLSTTVSFIVLTNIISELTSIIILIFFLPKNTKIRKKDLIPNKSYIRSSLSISIPNTTSRLIGSIGYFLEPIILTNVLLYIGYKNNFILTEYGILNGYVLPLVLLPSFFTLAISQALLPVVSKSYHQRKLEYTKKKIKQGIYFSLLIGIPTTIILVVFPEFFLQLFYKTTEGAIYMRVLAPICLFQYIQAPLSFSLDAMGKSKDNMLACLYGTIIRTVFLFLLSLLKIGMWGLIISTSINILVVTVHNLKKVRGYLTSY